MGSGPGGGLNWRASHLSHARMELVGDASERLIKWVCDESTTWVWEPVIFASLLLPLSCLS